MRINRISGLMPPAMVHRVEWYGPEKPRHIIPTPPEPPPPDNADWTGYAERRKVEDDMQGAARQAELQPAAGKLDPVQKVLAAARRAGLNQTEVMQLRAHLTAVLPEVQAEDLRFLRGTVLRCPHPLQGLRTFLEMAALAGKYPLRMRRDVALTLVHAVTQRGTKSRDPVASLNPDEASYAALALAGMTQEDFFHATRLLESTEEQTDRASILKEIAARHDSLVHPAIHDQFRNMCGLPSYFLGEVQAHATELLSKTGEVRPEGIGRMGLQEIQPSEYLKEGFFNPDNEMQAGIYGYCSAAMARRCREEGTSPDTVRDVVDVVSQIGEDLFELAGDEPELPLDDSTLASLKATFEMGDAGNSSALRELYSASEPWLQQFRDLAALAVHLERILRHMVG